MMRYYSIRILAAFFLMGSFAVGFLVGAEYGMWFGWGTFIVFVIIGALLIKVAHKIRQTDVCGNRKNRQGADRNMRQGNKR